MRILKYAVLSLLLGAQSSLYATLEDFNRCGIKLETQGAVHNQLMPKLKTPFSLQTRVQCHPITGNIKSLDDLLEFVASCARLITKDTYKNLDADPEVLKIAQERFQNIKTFFEEDLFQPFQYISSNKQDLLETLKDSKYDPACFFEMNMVGFMPPGLFLNTHLSFYVLESATSMTSEVTEKLGPSQKLEEDLKF